MNAPVTTTSQVRSVPRQDADQAFPAVLVNSTLGAIISLAGVWLTAVLAA